MLVRIYILTVQQQLEGKIQFTLYRYTLQPGNQIMADPNLQIINFFKLKSRQPERQSFPIQIPDEYENNQRFQNKLKSSINTTKKSANKISLLSKRQNTPGNRSPKKVQENQRVVNSSNKNYMGPVNIGMPWGDKHNNKLRIIKANTQQFKVIKNQGENQMDFFTQAQYEQRQKMTSSGSTLHKNVKQLNTAKEASKYNFNYVYQTRNQPQPQFQNPQPQPKHNISQLIEKQAISQINNQSLGQMSFLTGNRQSKMDFSGDNYSQKDKSKGMKKSENDKRIMKQMMDFVAEQIWIAKENYQKRFQTELRNNAEQIQKLSSLLEENEKKLKQKEQQLLKLNNSYSSNQSKISIKQQQSPRRRIFSSKQANSHQFQQPHQNQKSLEKLKQQRQKEQYLLKKVKDLEIRLGYVVEQFRKVKDNGELEKKVQFIEKKIIKLFAGKVNKGQNILGSFLGKKEEELKAMLIKVQKLAQTVQQHLLSAQSRQKQFCITKSELNKKLSQITSQFNDLQQQFTIHSAKQFKYQNYTVESIQVLMQQMHKKIQEVELKMQQHQKFLKKKQQLFMNKQLMMLGLGLGGKKFIKNLSDEEIRKIQSMSVDQSMGLGGNNISQDDLSHLLEKITLQGRSVYTRKTNRNNNSYQTNNRTIDQDDESMMLISMNFTSDPSESREEGQGHKEQHYEMTKKQINHSKGETISQATELQLPPKSTNKYNDMKQTNRLQPRPSLLPHNYYLPTNKSNLNNNIKPNYPLIKPSESSVQTKIRNLNDLKMQSNKNLVKLQQNQSPKKSPSHYQNHSNISINGSILLSANKSFLSISQMEDFVVGEGHDVTQEFGDDEFFYYYPEQNSQGKEVNEARDQGDWRENTYSEAYQYEPHSSRLASTIKNQEFSPQKHQIKSSTQQYFYQPLKKQLESPSVQSVKMISDRSISYVASPAKSQKPRYNEGLDGQVFSQEQQQEQISQTGHESNSKQKLKGREKKIVVNGNQLSQNQRTITEYVKKINGCNKGAIQIIYDRKRKTGVAKNDARKIFKLEEKQLKRLQQLGTIIVKTVI